MRRPGWSAHGSACRRRNNPSGVAVAVHHLIVGHQHALAGLDRVARGRTGGCTRRFVRATAGIEKYEIAGLLRSVVRSTPRRRRGGVHRRRGRGGDPRTQPTSAFTASITPEAFVSTDFSIRSHRSRFRGPSARTCSGSPRTPPRFRRSGCDDRARRAPISGHPVPPARGQGHGRATAHAAPDQTLESRRGHVMVTACATPTW